MATLMWISHSERPLNVNEICHALAVEIESTDININNIPSIRTVLGCCQGLAAVDERALTIRLIHFTLKEYLSRHCYLFDGSHSKIAETCLTYLNSPAIKDLSTNPICDFRDAPFLQYSCLYWGTHMRMKLSDHSRYLAHQLLDQDSNHISTQLLWGLVTQQSFTGYIGYIMTSPEPFSALHCVSYFGIVEVATDLIRTRRWDVNQRDSVGLTPLMWAAKYGHEELVKLLLQQKDIQLEISDKRYGRTALSWAAGSGHEGVVALFLSPLFVNPRSIGRRWRKIPQVMSRLFGRKYVNPDRPDRGHRTPLSWAAEGGHEGVVRLLLEREDVTPDWPDNCGQTPLSWAARKGRGGVVKLLLEREDVDPDRPDNDGETPLSWTAWNGHDGIMELLLEREDVTPDRPNNDGQTPLAWAARNGHGGVVKLLLGREDISIDRPDDNGKTPLSWAAWGGKDGAVGLLLGREDVNPDGGDSDGQTPLSWAARRGHDGAVKLLLGREDVTPDKPDNYGQTPLLWAARNGHDEVVKLLLEREDVSPDRPSNYGQTPLLWAARNGRDEVVKLLLEREEVSPDRPSNYGQTPLCFAAYNKHDGVVRLLKARKAAALPLVCSQQSGSLTRPRGGGLLRALDGTGWLSVVWGGRTAVLGLAGGPYRVRHMCSGQGGGKVGDCRER